MYTNYQVLHVTTQSHYEVMRNNWAGEKNSVLQEKLVNGTYIAEIGRKLEWLECIEVFFELLSDSMGALCTCSSQKKPLLDEAWLALKQRRWIRIVELSTADPSVSSAITTESTLPIPTTNSPVTNSNTRNVSPALLQRYFERNDIRVVGNIPENVVSRVLVLLNQHGKPEHKGIQILLYRSEGRLQIETLNTELKKYSSPPVLIIFNHNNSGEGQNISYEEHKQLHCKGIWQLFFLFDSLVTINVPGKSVIDPESVLKNVLSSF